MSPSSSSMVEGADDSVAVVLLVVKMSDKANFLICISGFSNVFIVFPPNIFKRILKLCDCLFAVCLNRGSVNAPRPLGFYLQVTVNSFVTVAVPVTAS